jgi:hypothetical protein
VRQVNVVEFPAERLVRRDDQVEAGQRAWLQVALVGHALVHEQLQRPVTQVLADLVNPLTETKQNFKPATKTVTKLKVNLLSTHTLTVVSATSF